MNDRFKYVAVSILVLIFFLLEYVWIPWDGSPVRYTIPFIHDGPPIRLDSLIYHAGVKVQHIILPLITLILMPFKKESKVMIFTFSLAFFELFLTWNEPIAQIPLPFDWYIPVSTSPLKFFSVCYFMTACIRRAFE